MILLRIVLIISVCLLSSCSKNKNTFPEDCKGYSAAIYQDGFAHAEGSYQDFGDYAVFARERIPDPISGWAHDKVKKAILLNTISESCAEKMRIHISNIELTSSDTIIIQFSHSGLSKDFPTASLTYLDADATIETYHLVDKHNNWLIIDQINADTTEIEGRFNLSFITTYEPYLNGEKERWDDPNRPDTLHFTNGQFRAVFASF